MSPPYPPGIVDRFMAWAERLPGPVWAFYLLLLLVLILIINAVAWLDGSLPFGTFDLYRSSVPVYPVASLVLMHYLNGVARRALAAFRPALGATDDEYARFEYELTTMPARGTWITLALSLVFTAVFTRFAPNVTDVFSHVPWLFAVDVAIYVFTFGLTAALLYHTLHQLRRVSRIHASAKNINLFQRPPLYAFSNLTAQTGIGLLLMNYFSILTDPATLVNPALFALTIFASLVAAVCFVLPLKGIRDRIVSEKKRLLAEANTRLEAAIQEVYRRADTHDLTGIDQWNQLMASLVTTREELSKIPTWPWELGTLTVFISAFLLPLLVRLLGELLARFLS